MCATCRSSFAATGRPSTRSMESPLTYKGEVMALIGESGSGKSVTLRALMRLHPPGSSELSGTLQVGDDEVLTMSASQLRRYRGGRCAMIFRSRCWPSIRSTPSGSRLLK